MSYKRRLKKIGRKRLNEHYKMYSAVTTQYRLDVPQLFGTSLDNEGRENPSIISDVSNVVVSLSNRFNREETYSAMFPDEHDTPFISVIKQSTDRFEPHIHLVECQESHFNQITKEISGIVNDAVPFVMENDDACYVSGFTSDDNEIIREASVYINPPVGIAYNSVKREITGNEDKLIFDPNGILHVNYVSFITNKQGDVMIVVIYREVGVQFGVPSNATILYNRDMIEINKEGIELCKLGSIGKPSDVFSKKNASSLLMVHENKGFMLVGDESGKSKYVVSDNGKAVEPEQIYELKHSMDHIDLSISKIANITDSNIKQLITGEMIKAIIDEIDKHKYSVGKTMVDSFEDVTSFDVLIYIHPTDPDVIRVVPKFTLQLHTSDHDNKKTDMAYPYKLRRIAENASHTIQMFVNSVIIRSVKNQLKELRAEQMDSTAEQPRVTKRYKKEIKGTGGIEGSVGWHLS